MTRTRAVVGLSVVLLAALVAGLFYPVARFEFINLDTYETIENNPAIRGLSFSHLKTIFTSRSINSYYPVRTLTLAVDYALWGGWAGGFKLSNVALHLANTLLVFWLALRLLTRAEAGGEGLPAAAKLDAGSVLAAALAAALFAAHPLVVEPVVWVPGREELLMTAGGLATLHCHIAAGRRRADGRRLAALACDGAATLSCAAACLSNAAGAIVPALVVAWDLVVERGRKRPSLLAATAPLWIIAVATIAIKKTDPWSYRYADDLPLVSLQRWRLALALYGLNLKSLFLPSQLALSYAPLAPSGAWGMPEAWGAVAAALTAAALLVARRWRAVFFALLWLLLAMAPAAQIIPHHIQRADRFLYLPLVGLALAVGVLTYSLAGRLDGRAARLGALAAALVVVLSMRTMSAAQVALWRDSLTVWRHSVETNPASAMAQRGLAVALAGAGESAGAVRHFERALALEPQNYDIMSDYAMFLAVCPDPTVRNGRRGVELAERAFDIAGGRDAKFAHNLARAYTAWGNDLYAAGQYAQGIDCFSRAIAADANYRIALLNQAWALATCPDASLRKPDEAVRLAQRAMAVAAPEDPVAPRMLATALAAAGRYAEAAEATEASAQRIEATGDAATAAALRSEAEAYRRQTKR